MGEAHKHFSDETCVAIQRIAGWERPAFPGTLNVFLTAPVPWGDLHELGEVSGLRVYRCTLTCHDDIEVLLAAIRLDSSRKHAHTVDLVAALHLRDGLRLADDDVVGLELYTEDCKHVGYRS